MINSEHFEKIKSFVSIANCIEFSPDMSRYSIGCGIDIIIEISSIISFVDCRWSPDGFVVSIGQASTEQMQELATLTEPKMLAKINELMYTLPV